MSREVVYRIPSWAMDSINHSKQMHVFDGSDIDRTTTGLVKIIFDEETMKWPSDHTDLKSFLTVARIPYHCEDNDEHSISEVSFTDNSFTPIIKEVGKAMSDHDVANTFEKITPWTELITTLQNNQINNTFDASLFTSNDYIRRAVLNGQLHEALVVSSIHNIEKVCAFISFASKIEPQAGTIKGKLSGSDTMVHWGTQLMAHLTINTISVACIASRLWKDNSSYKLFNTFMDDLELMSTDNKSTLLWSLNLTDVMPVDRLSLERYLSVIQGVKTLNLTELPKKIGERLIPLRADELNKKASALEVIKTEDPVIDSGVIVRPSGLRL